MKLGRSGWALIVAGTLGLVGCESGEKEGGEEAIAAAGGEKPAEGAKPAEPAAGQPAAAPEAPPGPAAVCGKLLEAIKGKDAKAVAEMSTAGAAEVLTAEVVEKLSTDLGTAACGEESIEGDKAMVKATMGDQTRELPFAKVENAWKFDHKAYGEKYPPEKGKGKNKKEKAKKAKKAKKGK